ncbi:crotonase/enoyl-CoA hydratase family protein [Marinivivus vitaminiproducens]|uniref:crotonase/enoyl-CoA hydratase family protein n=1 Tax=Marinivivus vitaminiproducens TaxID=3035935 RepID=UPI00279BBB3F|nr:crotonase/enoyl-CoA hydratase family protein [Geminicoccaceae bacterium SCSIO 64248]
MPAAERMGAMQIAARAMRSLSGIRDPEPAQAADDAAPAVLGRVDCGGDYAEIETRFEPEARILWRSRRTDGPTWLSLDMLAELRDVQTRLSHGIAEDGDPGGRPVRALVSCSPEPGIWCHGLDLRLLARLIRSENVTGLRRYLQAAIDALFPNTIGLHMPILTVALVQGDALGGGFEAALAHDVIVAESGTRLGLIDVRLGLPPGIGAFPLLARRIGRTRAERVLGEGRALTAEALQALGVVDLVAHPGQGPVAVRSMLAMEERRNDARLRLADARRRERPLAYDELLERAEHWIEAALTLQPDDLVRMDRLAVRQTMRSLRASPGLL